MERRPARGHVEAGTVLGGMAVLITHILRRKAARVRVGAVLLLIAGAQRRIKGVRRLATHVEAGAVMELVMVRMVVLLLARGF